MSSDAIMNIVAITIPALIIVFVVLANRAGKKDDASKK